MHLAPKPNNLERKNFLLEILLTPFRRIVEIVLKCLPNQDLRTFSLEELRAEWFRLRDELRDLPRKMDEQGRCLDFDYLASETIRISNRMIEVLINYRRNLARKILP